MSGRRATFERTAEVDRVAEVLKQLDAIADPTRLAGMARYGISTTNALGVSIPELRRVARRLGNDHDRALALWTTGVHEARILASMTDEVARVTPSQMDAWALEFDSWDLCDQVCGNLFDRTPHAFRKARAWSASGGEFVRRAGFATMACAAVHRKDVGDKPFEAFLPAIVGASTDERNYVKKAGNWALRQIGKRDSALNRQAIATAKQVAGLDSGAARWIAADALRELTSPAVQNRLRRASGERRRGRGRPLRPVRGSPGGRQSSAGTLTTSRSLSGTRTGSIVGSRPSTWI
jgi:3-methyladenine DNA glycosylase AlkD